jgi:hypothetical protein
VPTDRGAWLQSHEAASHPGRLRHAPQQRAIPSRAVQWTSKRLRPWRLRNEREPEREE